MDIDTLRKLVPGDDIDYLLSKGYVFESNQDGNTIHIIIHDYQFPESYQPRQTSILLILPAGYPNAMPDMFWTHPDVKLNNGSWPLSSEHHQEFSGKSWQRWSRHINTWRPGIDNLKTFMASVRKEINKGI